MVACMLCFDELAADEDVHYPSCQHKVCLDCFFRRCSVAAKSATDMADPFACPACKVPAFFVVVPPTAKLAPEKYKYIKDAARAERHLPDLWRAEVRATQDDDDDETTPMPTAAKNAVPTILYCSYWRNKSTLLALEMLCSNHCDYAIHRKRVLRQLQPQCDTTQTLSKRTAAVATLGRIHEGMRKRRRSDFAVLEEAQSLVELLEEEEEYNSAGENAMEQFVVDGGALYMVTLLRQQGNTHLWVHTNIGRAVARFLRIVSDPDCAAALIRATETSSRVLAVVVASESGKEAPKAVMRSLRLGQVSLSSEDAHDLVSRVRGVTAAPPVGL